MPDTERWRLDCTDAFEFLRSLSDDSAAAIVTDPPYSSGSRSEQLRGASTSQKYTQNGQKKAWVDFAGDGLNQRAYYRWSVDWLREAYRVLRPGAYLLAFIDWRQFPILSDAIQVAGYCWRSVVVWDKGGGARAPGRGRFRHQCEYVLVASKGKLPSPADAHFGVLPGCYRESVRQNDKHHLTGKPTPLMRQLVQVAPRGGASGGSLRGERNHGRCGNPRGSLLCRLRSRAGLR